MTVLAVNCALLAIPVDPLRLARASSEELVWLEAVVDDVNHRREQEAKRATR